MARNYTKGYVVKDHGKWCAIVNWQGEDGKQHRVTKSTGTRCSPKKGDNRNKAHAEAFLREWRDGFVRDEGEHDKDEEATGSDTPLAEYCKGYLALHEVEASTMSGYVAGYRKMLGTPMGKKPIGKVTADDVRAWEAGLREDGLSDTTIAHHHAFLAQVMKGAAAERKIAHNPMAAMRAPRRRPKPVNSLTSEQRAEILGKMEGMEDGALALAVRIALLTGMRRGEICALRWQDVDLAARTVHVVHGLTKDHGFRLDSPKDPSGGDATRLIPIGNVLTGHLRDHKERQRQGLDEPGTDWSDEHRLAGGPAVGHLVDRGGRLFQGAVRVHRRPHAPLLQDPGAWASWAPSEWTKTKP